MKNLQNKHLWTSLLVGAVIAGGAVAGNVTLPHVFQPNTPARASEVNANFNAVKTAVDDNDARLTSVEATASGVQTAVSTLQGTVTTTQNSLSSLQTAVANQAVDIATLQASFTNLTTRVTTLEQAPCSGTGPNDLMVRVGTLCVDKYEASVWSLPGGMGTKYGENSDDYPASFPDSGAWTSKLYAASLATGVPSSYLTWFQAAQACAASGKRLPTNAEWQLFAGGLVPDTRSNCNLASSGKQAPGPNCESGWGIVNTTGNVAEFTADWVTGNASTWSPGGITTLGASYGNNWLTGMQRTAFAGSEQLPNVIIRGGDFTHYRGTSATIIGGGSSAGPWRLWAETPPSYSDARFGFRCVK
jgi:hypothetical protein